MSDKCDALVSIWRALADRLLANGGRFAAARAQCIDKGIPFTVRILAPDEDHQLREWEPRFSELLSHYGFEVFIEHGVNIGPVSELDETDVVIVFPLSDNLRVFCVEFAKVQSRAAKMLICVPDGDDGKYYCRSARETYGVATIGLPVEKLVLGEDCRVGIDILRHCADDLMKKVAANVKRLRIENTVVVLVHGIRTRAMWQGQIQNALKDSGLVAIPTSYNKFDVIRFLLPSDGPKLAPLQRIKADIDSARKRFQDGHICVIAHSFGTYLIGRLLASREYSFDKIVLCGSVLRNDFDFSAVDEHFHGIINEIGCRDIWPALAAKVSNSYGPTGSFGFNRGNFVLDRKHDQYGHSHFLNREFCERFWIPYFSDGRQEERGDIDAVPSRLVRFIDSTWFTILLWSPAALLALLALYSVRGPFYFLSETMRRLLE